MYVHDLHLFVTVQLLEETPAVLSLGNGYTCEWASGQEPHLTKDGKDIICKTENFVPLVVFGLPSSSSTSSSSTSPPQGSSSSLNPSNSRRNQGAPGNWRKGAARTRLQDLPEWLEDFTENLEDAEVPALAEISHDSESECPIKVASRKHSIYVHFPKDQNCEVCKRTKTTRATCMNQYHGQKTSVT